MCCLYTCTPLSVRWANTVRSPERSAWPLLNFLQVYGSSSLRQISKLIVWSLRDIFTEGCFFYWSCSVFLIWYFLWHKWYFTVTDHKVLLKLDIAGQLSLKNIWVIVESRAFLVKEIWGTDTFVISLKIRIMRRNSNVMCIFMLLFSLTPFLNLFMLLLISLVFPILLIHVWEEQIASLNCMFVGSGPEKVLRSEFESVYSLCCLLFFDFLRLFRRNSSLADATTSSVAFFSI